MTIITERNETLTIINPMTNEVDEVICGKQLSKNAFLSFSKVGMYWAWIIHEFDAEIENGVVSPLEGRDSTVNPDGFIFNDEIYKIQIEIM